MTVPSIGRNYLFLCFFLLGTVLICYPTHALAHVEDNLANQIVGLLKANYIGCDRTIGIKENLSERFGGYEAWLRSQLALALLDSGYTVTQKEDIRAVWIGIEITDVQKIDACTAHIKLEVKIEDGFSGQTILHKKLTVRGVAEMSKETNRGKSVIIGSANIVAGGEVEIKNLNLLNNSENRTSSVNERDVRVGVHTRLYHPDINAILLFKTGSSFGRDKFEIHSAYFVPTFSRVSFRCGIFPLQFGVHSRYLNLSIERPYWDRGIIFDTRLAGFSSTMKFARSDFTIYWGTNRNPSAVLASELTCSPLDDLTFSGYTLYVNRDDYFNDIGQAIGFEIRYRHRGFNGYGIFALKNFKGNGGNLERQIVPLLGEYEYKLTENLFIKGMYLSLNQWVEGKLSIEETIYQELDFFVNEYLTPGIQYEYFGIGDFDESDYTGVLYWYPGENVRAIFKMRYIDPHIGTGRFFFDIEAKMLFE